MKQTLSALIISIMLLAAFPSAAFSFQGEYQETRIESPDPETEIAETADVTEETRPVRMNRVHADIVSSQIIRGMLGQCTSSSNITLCRPL